MDLLTKCMTVVSKCLFDARMDMRKLHEVVLVGSSSRIPKVQQLLQALLYGKELCKRINPDEAVAYGAAVQAAILAGTMAQEVVLVDVTPLSLGIECIGQVFSIVVPRNTTIPIRKEKIFTTAFDYRTRVRIQVYEGERARSCDNNLLGTFVLSEILTALRGIPQINVCFELDANSIMHVSAEDITTGSKKQITITNDKGRISAREIEYMVKEAERLNAEEEEHRRRVAAKEDLHNCIVRTRRKIKKRHNVLPLAEKKKMEDAIDKAIQLLLIGETLAATTDYQDVMEELGKLCSQILARFPPSAANISTKNVTPLKKPKYETID
ncbi:OLC1v1025379C1 [Oldenlandia corymbosa var. corymbosa]|nr:OLC1v1025379C1 [Oldenlandia corymbosa var. corymbosa]